MSKSKIKPRISTLFYFINPYPKYIVVIFILILLSAIFEGANIVILFGLLGAVLAPGSSQLTGSGILAAIFNVVNKIPIQDKIVAVAVLMITVTVIKSVLVFLRQIFTYYAGYKIWYDIQEKVFVKYINADYQYFLDHKQGEMIFRAYSAPGFMGGVLQYAGEALALIVQLIAIGFVLFSISPQISLIVFLFGGAFYFFTDIVAKNISYHLGRGRTEACEKQNMLLAELINGIKQIKVFLSEKRWFREYVRAMRDYFMLAIKDRVWHELPTNVVEIFAIILLCGLVMVLKAFNPQAFVSQLSLLGTFAYAFYRFMPYLKRLGTLRINILGNLPIVELLHSVVEEDICTIPDGDIDLKDFKEDIVFEDVNFSYPTRSITLENVDFEVKKGRTLAIVGPSGVGKSTVINLLLRIFVPAKGKIKIDGLDLNDIRLNSWLSKIGYVSQETFIFDATIEDNIVFGRPYDKNRVIEVAKLANAHEFIESFPQGYNTEVGERGLKLSGGQRQRIAIARAIYNNPQILVLDEATSALDNVSEAKVQEAIRKVTHGHTVILVAHRLSTIIDADRIIVLDGGKVVEEGSHEALLRKRGTYWNLYRDQKETFNELEIGMK